MAREKDRERKTGSEVKRMEMEKGKRIKKASVFFGAALAGLLAVSCGDRGGKDAEGFPPAETLVADSVAIEQVLSVSGWDCRDRTS